MQNENQKVNIFNTSSRYKGVKLTKDELIQYYDYVRKEIEREDKLTYERAVTTLTFQGFLLTAIALMMGKNGAIEFGIAISIAGIFLSIMSFLGIRSARKSLENIKEEWVLFKNKNGKIYPYLVPQPIKNANITPTENIKKLGKTNNIFLRFIRNIFRVDNRDKSYEPNDHRVFEFIKSMYVKLVMDSGSIYFQSIPIMMMIFWGVLLILFLTNAF